MKWRKLCYGFNLSRFKTMFMWLRLYWDILFVIMNSDFKYKKDSVLVVTEEEYEKCHSVHPIFFSNNGGTVFKFDQPGLFYFISGVAGHCERGQKMIIKVLEPETPPQSANDNTTTTDSPQKSGAVEMAAIYSPIISMLFMVSFFGALFIWMQCNC